MCMRHRIPHRIPVFRSSTPGARFKARLDRE
jgi:hypothetical protein